jgi:hypothetical protein
MMTVPSGTIPFCREMAIAYRQGRKTQTRRVAGKRQYGRSGDRVVLRTTWATETRYDHIKPTDLPDDARIWSYFESDERPSEYGRLRVGMFLPKKFWSLMPCPRIVEKRVERVQDISLDDARAEGVESRMEYADLWNLLNFDRGYSWASNPKVVVIDLQPWRDL